MNVKFLVKIPRIGGIKVSKDKTMSKQIEEILNEVIHNDEIEDKQIFQLDDNHLRIADQEYQIVHNYRDGYDKEAFTNIYNSFFEKYDFIVGDWGHEKLRLRGFYQIGRRKVPRDQQIDFLDDYLKEYCNFGCAYFVLAKDEEVEKFENLKDNKLEKKHQRSSRRRRKKISATTNSDRQGNKSKSNHRNNSIKTTNKSDFQLNKIDKSKTQQKSNTNNRSKQSGKDFVITRRKKGN